MSTATKFAGLGEPHELVKLVPKANVAKAGLTTQDGFVLSRIDGQATIAALCKITGLGEATTIDILKKLVHGGLISIGDRPPVVINTLTGSPPAPPPTGSNSTKRLSAILDRDSLPDEEPPEDAVIDLDPALRRKIRRLHARLDLLTYFELLGVDENADTRVVRRAYFALSKEFHPDRYYNRRTLGRYEGLLADIFKHIAAAYRVLEDDAKREQYRRALKESPRRTQTGDTPRRPTTASKNPVAGESPRRPTGEPMALKSTWTGAQPRERRASSEENRVNPPSRERVVLRERVAPIAVPEADEVEQAKAQPLRRSDASGSQRVTGPKAVATAGLTDALADLEAALSRATAKSPPGDPEEADRRAEDRQRRRRMTAVVNPEAQRRQRAVEFFNQGKQQSDEGKVLAAAASLKLAVTYDPENTAYQAAYEAASQQARQLSADSYYKRAGLEESLGNVDSARDLYLKAADTSPRCIYLTKAAEVLLDGADLMKAKLYAKKAVQDQSNSVDARVVLAKIFRAEGLIDHARRELEMALKLQPQHQQAIEVLRSLK